MLDDLKTLVCHGRVPAGGPVRGLVAAALAVVTGAALSALLALDDPLRGTTSALLGVVWVAVRLPVMRLVYAPASEPESQRVTGSWSAGAMPYLFAVVPLLRTAAWMTGAVLAFRVLAADGNRPRAVRTVLAGFGIEAVGVAAVLLARNVRVLLEVLGG